MELSALLGKLRYKPGMRAAALNAPPDYGEAIAGAGFAKTLGEEKAQFTILFVRNRAELDKYAAPTIAGAEEDSLIWLAYLKGGAPKTDLNRDIIWGLLRPMEMRPVALVAVDEEWSAMRLRPEGRVKG